jgi:DNA repair photolyase
MRATYREEPCKSALNPVKGMPFAWSLNPYTGCSHRCAFCYVRGFEKRADRPSDARYGTTVRVKTNFVTQLRSELARKSWKREPVAIGAATDPYQPTEAKYRLTRGTIETLAEFLTPFHIITRGPLIVRDLDVLVRAARRVKLSINMSISTLDPKEWRELEPGAPDPRQRLRAVKTLSEAGIDVGIGIAPVIPGVTDTPAVLAQVVRAARAAGATRVWSRGLYLAPGTREHFLDALAKGWPEERARYAKLYARGSYLPKEEDERLRDAVRALAREHGIADRRAVRLVPEEAAREEAPGGQLGLGLATARAACTE